MKWLADENIPFGSIHRLRAAGVDVSTVVEINPGAGDEEILNIARNEGRSLLTFDRDFGELVFQRQLPAPPAVVYMRFVPRYPEEPADIILRLFGGETIIAGHFIVLDRESFRRRKLPDVG